MKLDKSTSLFFATKIDSKLREGLALSKPGDKKYFDGSSEEFLRVMEIGDAMSRKGWHLNALNNPPAVHIACTVSHAIVAKLTIRKFCSDLFLFPHFRGI